MVFDSVETLELHWCTFTTLYPKMQFPGVRYYSESSEILPSSNRDILHIARTFLDQLNVLGLRFEYDRRSRNQKYLDTGALYRRLEQAKDNGRLQRCVIQRAIVKPPDAYNSWISYHGRQDDYEEVEYYEWERRVSGIRQALLKLADPHAGFRESQEPESFRKRGPWI